MPAGLKEGRLFRAYWEITLVRTKTIACKGVVAPVFSRYARAEQSLHVTESPNRSIPQP
jgi:hypothetical protein